MRLVKNLFTVTVIVVVSIIVLSIVGYTGYVIYITSKNTVENISSSHNLTINITDYDIVSQLEPTWIIVDIALIIAFIFMVVAVFMHSKKR